jgi:hypothetical protein
MERLFCVRSGCHDNNAPLILNMTFPTRPEVAGARAMAFVKKFGFDDAICPEVPKSLTKLTSGRRKTAVRRPHPPIPADAEI